MPPVTHLMHAPAQHLSLTQVSPPYMVTSHLFTLLLGTKIAQTFSPRVNFDASERFISPDMVLSSLVADISNEMCTCWNRYGWCISVDTFCDSKYNKICWMVPYFNNQSMIGPCLDFLKHCVGLMNLSVASKACWRLGSHSHTRARARAGAHAHRCNHNVSNLKSLQV